MNKTAIKNFAVWARRKFISDIKYKAGMLGITDSGIAEPLPISTKDLQFFDIGTKDYAEVSGNEISQRKALVDAIKKKEKSSKTYKEAFEYIVEEVAYTWFNRLIAIRFMEVNDYLTHSDNLRQSVFLHKTVAGAVVHFINEITCHSCPFFFVLLILSGESKNPI